MPHANEQLVRRIYTAFVRGDMEGVLADCSDDVLFSIPGTNKVAGTYHGREGFFTAFLPALAAVADMRTFEEDIDALACDDDHGVILTTQRFRRHDGQQVAFRSAVDFRFRDGKLSEFRERPGNQEEYDQAWS
jgi:ketosteroid isomerase-like protein